MGHLKYVTVWDGQVLPVSKMAHGGILVLVQLLQDHAVPRIKYYAVGKVSKK